MAAELFDAGRIEVGSPASASSTALRVKAFDTPTSNAAASVALLWEPTGLPDPPSRTGPPMDFLSYTGCSVPDGGPKRTARFAALKQRRTKQYAADGQTAREPMADYGSWHGR